MSDTMNGTMHSIWPRQMLPISRTLRTTATLVRVPAPAPLESAQALINGQTFDPPAFTLVSRIDVSTQGITLLRFDAKKDHREAQYIEVGIWSGAKVEDKHVIPPTVTRSPNSNNLTIVPESDLSAGKCFLITDAGKGADGYDFGVK